MIRAFVPPEITYTRTNPLSEIFDDDATSTWSSATTGARFVEAVLPDWKGPPFAQLANTDPLRLITLIRSNTLAFHDLTFAAEAAGMIPTPDARKALLALLDHSSPLVREGAIYGLSHFLGESGDDAKEEDWVRTRLKFFAISDPVAGVRAAAAEALSE